MTEYTHFSSDPSPVRRIGKRILKLLLTLLVIVVILVVWLLIFSHFPAFYRLIYPGIDDRMSEYPAITADVPADFAARTVHGITVKAPADCINPKDSGISPFKSDDLMILVLTGEESLPYSDENAIFFKPEAYAHFFSTIGVKMPESSYEDIVFLRDQLTADTCRHLHGKDYLIYLLMAYSKHTVDGVETAYFYHGEQFDGLVCEVHYGRTKKTNVMICDAAHRNCGTVMISCDDETLTRQIIAGLDVTAFMAGQTE